MRTPTVLTFYPQYPDLFPGSLEIAYRQQVASLVIPVPDTGPLPVAVVTLQPPIIYGRDKLDIQLDHIDSIFEKSARKDIAMMKIYRYHGSGVTTSAERGRTGSANFVLPLSLYSDGSSFPC